MTNTDGVSGEVGPVDCGTDRVLVQGYRVIIYGQFAYLLIPGLLGSDVSGWVTGFVYCKNRLSYLEMNKTGSSRPETPQKDLLEDLMNTGDLMNFTFLIQNRY